MNAPPDLPHWFLFLPSALASAYLPDAAARPRLKRRSRMNHRRKIPKYRLHKPSGQAVVTLSGRDFYLGRHGSEVSRVEFDRLVAEWLANDRRLAPDPEELSLQSSGESADEAARVILGHRSAAVTEIYAEIDRSRALEIIGSVG